MTALAVRQTRPKIGLSAGLQNRDPKAAGPLAPVLGGRVRWVAVTGNESASGVTPQGLAGLIQPASPCGENGDRTDMLPVTDPDAMKDPGACEHFVERVFAHGRLVDLFSADWQPRDLVDFHTNHKLQLFSHDPSRTRELGRLVAHAREQRNATALEHAYQRSFAAIMATPATIGRRTDALLHAAGYLPGGSPETVELRARIDGYRRGEQPFESPLSQLTRLVFGYGIGYLIRQTFLDPLPQETDL